MNDLTPTISDLAAGDSGAPQTTEVLPSELKFETKAAERLTHYMFRYPAKFHPPVARALLLRYTSARDLVLDPFCGSGTLLVEALANGRSSLGIDVDPVAVAVTKAKIHRYRPASLSESAALIETTISRHERPSREYDKRMFEDLSPRAYSVLQRELADYIPDIPNLLHWFRRYVVIDLARILKVIETVAIPETHRDFFRIVFASIIRNSSNADPVPVSGLEVTAHMKRQNEAGRLINPFGHFKRAIAKAVDSARDLHQSSDGSVSAMAFQGDATRLRKMPTGVDAIITSPPYHGAVDYYRRHQLEMFWLKHTKSQVDRLRLLDKYIGRPKVPRSHRLLSETTLENRLASYWEKRIRASSPDRADAFKHYIVSMGLVFNGIAQILNASRPAVFVVGHSSWNGTELPTTDLFQEIAGSQFSLQELLCYPVKNRYMSYSRHNDANISMEYVLAFRKTRTRTKG